MAGCALLAIIVEDANAFRAELVGAENEPVGRLKGGHPVKFVSEKIVTPVLGLRITKKVFVLVDVGSLKIDDSD